MNLKKRNNKKIIKNKKINKNLVHDNNQKINKGNQNQ